MLSNVMNVIRQKQHSPAGQDYENLRCSRDESSITHNPRIPPQHQSLCETAEIVRVDIGVVIQPLHERAGAAWRCDAE